MPSFTLIHPTIWPVATVQYTNVTDRQIGQTDRQDRTDRQLSDSIVRTVSQMVAKK